MLCLTQHLRYFDCVLKRIKHLNVDVTFLPDTLWLSFLPRCSEGFFFHVFEGTLDDWQPCCDREATSILLKFQILIQIYCVRKMLERVSRVMWLEGPDHALIWRMDEVGVVGKPIVIQIQSVTSSITQTNNTLNCMQTFWRYSFVWGT